MLLIISWEGFYELLMLWQFFVNTKDFHLLQSFQQACQCMILIPIDFWSLQFFSYSVATSEKKVADTHSSKTLKKKEIEIVTKATIDKYHSQYVDICQWNPKNQVFVTASTDR